MDIVTIITILSGIAAIIGLVYFLLIGQRSLPEWLRERRRKPVVEGSDVKSQKKLLSYEQHVSVLRGFWRFHEELPIDIVCSEIPEAERHYFANPADRNYLRYAKFGDLDSLIYVRGSLGQVFPKLHIRDFSPSEHFDTHTNGLIVIGGPSWNSKFREFQVQLPFYFIEKPVGQDDILVIPSLPDYAFHPTWDENKRLIKDISIFARIIVEKEIPGFLIGGCLTFGVLGASKCFLDRTLGPSNVDYMESIVGRDDFISVFETFRMGSFILTPNFSVTQPLLILRRSNITHGFETALENANNYCLKK